MQTVVLSVIEGIFGHFLAHFLDHASRERLWKTRLLPCKLMAPHEDMRVSFSAFLRIVEGDGYLLVRSLHRKEAFGPFGGVYKHHEGARRELDDLEFRSQGHAASNDMKNDVRGFLPRRRVLAFAGWFDRGGGREDGAVCVRRELAEEIKEVRLASRHPIPDFMQFRHVRRVHEGPARAAGQTYSQYRIFDIFDIVEPSNEIALFLADLRSTASSHKDLMMASAREIVAGRSTDGRVIGHHSGYLFGRKRIRPDEPMFVESNHI